VLTEPEEFVHTVESEAAFFEGQDWEKGDQAWLAFDEDIVVGIINAHAGRKRKITHRINFGMGVSATHRATGIGHALLKICVDHARAHPAILKVELHVFTDNIPAIQLYLKHGFVEEGRIARYARRPDGSFVDSLAMGLLLS
jgi:putative acetyltransferase